QYAHEKRVFHRALSPQSILVWDPEADAPELRILNWQAAAHEALTTRATQAGISGTSHLDELVEDASRVYLAPEAVALADASPETLDVFSLGAVAFFILSGKPPAPSVLDLHDSLRQGKGLQLPAAVDGADSDVAALIELATDPVVAHRVSSVKEFLRDLEEDVEKRLPKADPDEITETPENALTGDLLAGGFRVLSRLGKGSTSSVFLVEHKGEKEVLKLANAEADDRLRAEAEVLEGIKHPRIVQLLGTATVGERFALRLSVAGEGTLAQRLRREGRLQLELLQRFGEDLLEAVDYLERTGVPHRDIKPDNLGVTKAGRNDELHLVLFDFSLTRTRAENIFAGTRPYLDPFLRERKARRWDLQAERYAAAVTLYEMATGVLPRWGDGTSDPVMIKDEANIEAELLDAAVRSSLADFFRQALRRDPRQRFDNAREMLAAWSRAFAGTDRPATTTAEEQPDELARACAEASLETPVSLLHLSTRAVNALERAQVATVHDLLRTPVSRLNRLRGVGSKTRKELVDALEILTRRFGDLPAAAEPVPAPGPDSEPTVLGLDLLVRQLLPARANAGGERRILETLFGLEPASGPLTWPSQSGAAEILGLTRARASQILVKARRRWRSDRSLTLLRDHIAGLLEAHGGAMTHEELCAALLATRGSVQDEPLRTRHAAAVLRAATEAEEEDRWIFRRDEARRDPRHPRVLFALRLDDQPEALLDYAAALGRKADE
ncbi:MAG TPA: protein kinase, partial [Thermoanaerobaculia bacterium]|nr:protein kinase [Thermoanaerobaculia bacterium]